MTSCFDGPFEFEALPFLHVITVGTEFSVTTGYVTRISTAHSDFIRIRGIPTQNSHAAEQTGIDGPSRT